MWMRLWRWPPLCALPLLAPVWSPAYAQTTETEVAAEDCDSSGGEYDLNLHIMGTCLLLVSSAFGVFAPLVLGQQASRRRWINESFFCLRHFGNGVLIATAFIHLIFEGFDMFADPCLTQDLAFEPAAPAIAMAGLVIVFTIDFVTVRSMVFSQPDQETSEVSQPAAYLEVSSERKAEGTPEQLSVKEKKQHWEVNMLEGGTVFHSFIVGLTIGAQAGPGFNATLAAILFHQMFEGAGLGARIATLRYLPGQAWKKWTMAAVFAMTTSTGMTLGILIRHAVNLNGSASLIVVGTLESLASGALLYASTSTLLVGDWLHGDMLRASNRRVLTAAFCFTLGMGVMAFIGKYV